MVRIYTAVGMSDAGSCLRNELDLAVPGILIGNAAGLKRGHLQRVNPRAASTVATYNS